MRVSIRHIPRSRAPHSRPLKSRSPAFLALLSLPAAVLLLAGAGCGSTPDPMPVPSAPTELQRAIDAMDREEWEEADRILDRITPAPPEETAHGHAE